MGWPENWSSLEPFPKEKWEEWLELQGKPWMPDPFETIPRVATGIKDRVSRLKAIGNGQVPQCMALAWEIMHPTARK
jgi:hypothetical protein